jgi:hypothetical protein
MAHSPAITMEHEKMTQRRTAVPRASLSIASERAGKVARSTAHAKKPGISRK